MRTKNVFCEIHKKAHNFSPQADVNVIPEQIVAKFCGEFKKSCYDCTNLRERSRNPILCSKNGSFFKNYSIKIDFTRFLDIFIIISSGLF